MSDLSLNLKKTALVVIDLQEGIVKRPNLAPYSSEEVLENNATLAEALKNTEALIVLVHVQNYGGEILHPLTDQKTSQLSAISENFSDFSLAIAQDKKAKNVISITKHNWGAFYGTDLDVQLRRRGIDTIILTGVATSMGVDTTAREAFQRGYNLILVEDATSDMDMELHQLAFVKTFPKFAKVRTTKDILSALFTN